MTPMNTHAVDMTFVDDRHDAALVSVSGHASAILAAPNPLTLASSVSVRTGRFVEHVASEVGRRSRGRNRRRIRRRIRRVRGGIVRW